LAGPDADPDKIGLAMKKAFNNISIESSVFVSKVNKKGPIILA
jgi:hypothetical protein